jgi:catechol 2,3-dioxygenase-like lactoylglutathione lyase family enzyme
MSAIRSDSALSHLSNRLARDSLLSDQTIPIFRMFDVAKAKEFYVDWLGFTVDWEHTFEENMPVYMQVSRDNLILHLSEHHGDCSPGAKIIVNTDQVEELHREIIARNYKYNRPGLERPPWGVLCFTVIDPFGNRITFSKDLKQQR